MVFGSLLMAAAIFTMEGTVESSYFSSLQIETLGLITSEITTMNTFFLLEEDVFKVINISVNFDDD